MAKKLYYKIGEACKDLDIQPYVLRYWETEFAALRPNKSKSGQRVYSEEDLAVIRRIKELLYDEGYTIAGAKKKLGSEDLAALTTAGAEEPEAEEAEEDASRGSEPEKPKESKKSKEPDESDESDETPDGEEDGEAAVEKEEPRKSKPAAAKKAAAAGLSAEVRAGLEKALAETREILELLDKSGSKR